jgi:hypothetical protein
MKNHKLYKKLKNILKITLKEIESLTANLNFRGGTLCGVGEKKF